MHYDVGAEGIVRLERRDLPELPQGHSQRTLRLPLHSAGCPSARIKGEEGGVFFCTFTCYNWLPLIEAAAMYDWVYNWFVRLHNEGNEIIAYVIMPNHMHVLIQVPHGRTINRIMTEGKRFMAYAIRKRPVESGRSDLLTQLQEGVRAGDAQRGQRYRVFETSTDIKKCLNVEMVRQKVKYIHANPVKGKWALVEDVATYPHSSAAAYMTGADPKVPLLLAGEIT